MELYDTVQLVEQAFENVTLEDGMGLRQAYLHDPGNAALESFRPKSIDERLDWTRIKIPELNSYEAALCYFDPKGMKFHLPAFMKAALNDLLDFDLVTYLISDDVTVDDQYSPLTVAQRHAVHQFLELCRLDCGMPELEVSVEHALSRRWRLE